MKQAQNFSQVRQAVNFGPYVATRYEYSEVQASFNKTKQTFQIIFNINPKEIF